MIEHLRSRVGASENARRLSEAVTRDGSRVRVGRLVGSLKSLLIAQVYRATHAPMLIVTPDELRGEWIYSDLRCLLGAEDVGFLPAPSGSPYRREPVPDGVVAERLSALRTSCAEDPAILVVPIASLQLKVPTPKHLASHTHVLLQGGSLEPGRLVELLIAAGYERAHAVGQVGEFSRRGGIVDVHPVGRDTPVRAEFDGNEVVSLRAFDPLTQRSAGRVEQVLILPRSEWLLPPDPQHALATAGDGRDVKLLRELLGQRPPPAGMEWFAPLLGLHLHGLDELLPPETVLWMEDPEEVATRAAQRDRALRQAAAEAAADGLPTVELDTFHRRWPALSSWLAGLRGFDDVPGSDDEVDVAFDARPQDSYGGNLRLLRVTLARSRGGAHITHVLCETEGQMRRLHDVVGGEADGVMWGVGNLRYGFVSEDLGLSLLTAHEIFDRGRRHRRLRRYGGGLPIRDQSGLHLGDYVVHAEHGIARYGGLRRLEVDGRTTDCLVLNYAGEDVLYVPADNIAMVERYQGDGAAAPAIHRLGGSEWRRAKRKAQRAATELAAELLRLNAVRSSSKGHAYSTDGLWQQEMEAAFGYLDTPDQRSATDEIKRDMESDRPMDRLICGDVGYGKTELAMRAAFKAVSDSKQVAVLVPTTLLARQHLDTFRRRFSDFPVRVELLSRLRGKGAQKDVIRNLAEGTVDIVIGTHRLLSREVRFKDLGLIIIDEEHRFGVAQKERLKRYNEVADVLSLTATPIPRTLHLSLMGAKDMTMVSTPPPGRKSISTRISEFDEEVIAGAIRRELDRGGQVFFVHNRVQSIHVMAGLVSSLVPEAAIGIAHGQMKPGELETVVQRFVEREYDVLVTTMIIGSGMDIPSANTLIVSRADRLGLAQLYQLRGRVGRSDEQAYAYLLIPPRTRLGETARNRLEALREFSQLGSGFRLAMRDLQIRGMGNLLGPEQHGHIVTVGFEMYCKLLSDAVREVRGESVEAVAVPKVRTTVDAFLPHTYVPDESMKLELYRKLAAAESSEEVEEIREEMQDRCGPLPGPARSLIAVAEVRIAGTGTGVEEVDVGPDTVRLTFRPDLVGRLSTLQDLEPRPNRIELTKDNGLRVMFPLPQGEDPVRAGADLVRKLAGELRPAAREHAKS
jgi:transcription-repair coupling factor (superfamily II helicase)